MNALALFFIGFGIVLLMAGISASPWNAPDSAFLRLTSVAGMGGAAVWLRARWKRWRQRRRLHGEAKPLSELAQSLVPQVRGDYSPYAIEAAELLSAAHDTTAVPDLLEVLEDCVNHQRPGWRDVAAAVADALAEIGDVRSLPTLRRIESVRGIGLIPNIRHAIAVLEPQANLLRASADAVPATLLRPARAFGEEPSQMLRPINRD